MKHDPVKVAAACGRTAALVAEHGDRTARTIAEWSAGASSAASGPGQINAVSDPTGNAAVGEHDPLASLHVRWQAASIVVVDMSVRNGVCPTSPTPLHDRLSALSRLATTWVGAMHQQNLSRLYRATGELDAVIYMAAPIDKEAAEEELREAKYLEHRASDCQACESPAERLKSGLCVPGCYDLQRRWVERGRIDMADPVLFKAAVVSGVSRGEIGRASSPYWMRAAPRVVHEGEVA